MRYYAGDKVLIVDPPYGGGPAGEVYRGQVGVVHDTGPADVLFRVKVPGIEYAPVCEPKNVRPATDEEILLYKLTL